MHRIGRFATFATLYMMALFLEPGEKWHYPIFTGGLLLLCGLLLLVGLTRRTFPILLAVATIHPLVTQFPDVANHVNVEITCNLLLLVAIAYSLAHRDRYPADDDCFELVRPVLQVTMILVYVFAGFAKLNRDFLNPAVSCVGDMMRDLDRVASIRVPILHAPAGLFILAGTGVLAAALVSARGSGRTLRPAARVGALSLIVVPATLALNLAPEIPGPAAALGILGMSCIVILWEFFGGALLTVPRFQAPLLAFSWAMHAILAFIGFVHFGALAFAMLFTFLPSPYIDMMTSDLRLPIVRRSLPRIYAFFAMTALAGMLSWLTKGYRRPSCSISARSSCSGPSFAPWWPRCRGPRGPASPSASRLTPRWLYLFPVFVALHGLTSYLGLRTAGNFTMFSNLRTEGPRSNHLLLGSNPVKMWGYQEDVVRFTRFDDRLVPPGYAGQSLVGRELPVVEFKKWIYEWTSMGATVPMAFVYQGQVHTTTSIVADPVWRTEGRNWEMRLMDFRLIQPEGPNRCRW